MKQREIKFRAWDKKDRRMYYNIQKGIKFTDLSHYTFNEFLGYPEGMGDYHEWEVMQFTGLKDKNGKEIYISDIVFSEDGEYSKTIEIKERKDCLGINFNGIENRNENYDEPGECGDEDNLEIIGNIYENKDLLKGL